MGRATDMLHAGRIKLEGEFGEFFTVVGVSGFAGACLAESLPALVDITAAGDRENATISISFARTVSWTPSIPARVTFRGRQWAVTSIRQGPAIWTLAMQGINQ